MSNAKSFIIFLAALFLLTVTALICFILKKRYFFLSIPSQILFFYLLVILQLKHPIIFLYSPINYKFYLESGHFQERSLAHRPELHREIHPLRHAIILGLRHLLPQCLGLMDMYATLVGLLHRFDRNFFFFVF
jgi:energy-coupling factor transporter transmembrane protein EcfT